MARDSGAKRPRGRPRQLKLPLPAEFFVPGTTVIVKTDDLDLMTDDGAEECLRRIVAVPLDKSVLLDFLVGRKGKVPAGCGGDERTIGEKSQLDGLTEEQVELWRLQRLLNSRFRGQRFAWFGSGLVPGMVRQAIANLPQIVADIAARRAATDSQLERNVTLIPVNSQPKKRLVGMLWQDTDSKRSLEEKVRRGASHYEKKYSRPPVACHLAPAALPQGVEAVDNIRLRPDPNVKATYLLFPLPEEEATSQVVS